MFFLASTEDPARIVTQRGQIAYKGQGNEPMEFSTADAARQFGNEMGYLEALQVMRLAVG